MAVGHDQQPGIVGQAGHFAFRRVGDLDLDAGRHMVGEGIGPRIEPADATRQGRQHLYDSLADMAGAEQRDGEQVRPLRLKQRSEEHTSELQSLMRSAYAVLCLNKKKNKSTSCKE